MPRPDNTLVVLLQANEPPEDIAPRLCALLTEGRPARLLLLSPDIATQQLAAKVAAAQIEVEAVTAAGDTCPVAASIPSICLPDRASAADFALALSDVVLVIDSALDSPVAARARTLRHPIVTLEGGLPAPFRFRSIADRLDPERKGWHARGSWFFGRLEQVLLELLAFNWLGCSDGGIGSSCRRIRKSFGLSWRPGVYHGPPDWLDGVPDRAAKDPGAPTCAHFASLDRAALHGSYIHRDLIWMTHLAAAFAVLFAVIGTLWPGHLFRIDVWPTMELIILVLVLVFIIAARVVRLQDRWTACRLGAEQLRIARMCLPLRVVPPKLLEPDESVVTDACGRSTDFTGRVMWEVKRAVRDHGIPQVQGDYSPVEAARWLASMIKDQAGYHRQNWCKLEHAEGRLAWLIGLFFTAALASVIAELIVPAHPWLLLPTAAGPAFAAALHGAETRLGIVHRAALSRDTCRELSAIHDTLDTLAGAPPASDIAWRQVRAEAAHAANVMGSENITWHSLVRRQRDDIPA